ncbi:UbiA family prenyltransferase [Desertibaculum subflavum]|uniref:UbiA family prenyltransferase n=1 Tax=Desertibaculum subflavum TaxID=2268458 RepID=UPI000E66A845
MVSQAAATAAAGGDEPALRPLCVDLDGTLVRTDTLFEMVAAALRDWRVLLMLPLWLLRGRAVLKQEMAKRLPLDPAALPYETRLIDYLRRERARGRRVILATATDRRIAEAIAGHLGQFDEVLASDGVTNLKGPRKAAALVGRFGQGGFAYAGNDRPDLQVWQKAGGVLLVNADSATVRAARAIGPVELELPREARALKALVRACRPHQWMKNLLVFVPIVTAGAVGQLEDWLLAIAAFMAFSLIASGIYLLNDLSDLPADRAHPRKSRRPLASGALDIRLALLAAPVLLAVGGWVAWSTGILWVLAVYVVTSTGYSMRLKEFPLVDMFALATLYTLRLYAGGEATGHPVSNWLLAFSIFLFLGLAAVKRVAELQSQAAREGGAKQLARRGYLVDDVQIVTMMGVAASFVASLVLALYVQNQWIAGRGGSSAELFWLLVPLALFWQCRLWLATARGYMDDDPIVYAARDWVSRLVAIAGFLVFIVADGHVARAAGWTLGRLGFGG